MDFMVFLNSLLGSIKFIEESEKEEKLPFLDILLIRKLDGSLGRNVYRKPTHTNVYINSQSHHHPAQKWASLSTLVYRALNIADEQHLDEELVTLN